MIAEILAFLIALIIVVAVFRFFEEFSWKKLLMNTVAGLVAMLILNLFGFSIPITLLTLFIVAITGLVGLLLIIILHFLGVAF